MMSMEMPGFSKQKDLNANENLHLLSEQSKTFYNSSQNLSFLFNKIES